jgi:cobalt-zinc-cadmium efflux system membrane fusion protein
MLAILFLLWGCTKNQDSSKGNEDSHSDRKMETCKVSSQEVSSYIEATGTIQPDTEGTAKITPQLPGIVKSIFVRVGDRARRGASLASIRSPEVSDAYSNYLSNLSQLRAAKRVFDLNKQLSDVGAVTKNELLSSEANYEQLKALSEALKKKLEIYGVSSESGFTDEQILKSPIDGSVIEIQGHIGDRVDSTTPLMTVADPHRVMVVANIYDTEVSRIQKGQEVNFYTDIFPDTPFRGVVSYISDASDQEAKTIKTYIRIKGDQRLFKQNSFLKIKIANGRKRLPVIPKTSLLYKDGKFDVYMYVEGKIEVREVRPAFEVSEKLIAVEGLQDGDEIVLSAIGMEKT